MKARHTIRIVHVCRANVIAVRGRATDGLLHHPTKMVIHDLKFQSGTEPNMDATTNVDLKRSIDIQKLRQSGLNVLQHKKRLIKKVRIFKMTSFDFHSQIFAAFATQTSDCTCEIRCSGPAYLISVLKDVRLLGKIPWPSKWSARTLKNVWLPAASPCVMRSMFSGFSGVNSRGRNKTERQSASLANQRSSNVSPVTAIRVDTEWQKETEAHMKRKKTTLRTFTHTRHV